METRYGVNEMTELIKAKFPNEMINISFRGNGVYMVTFGRVCCYVITRNNTIIDIQYD
jgi:hypothetical protein